MKKLKRKLLTAMLYTICYRNVDKYIGVWLFTKYDLLGGLYMEKDFEQIELCEKDGMVELRMNGKKIKGLIEYGFEINADRIDFTFSIAVPALDLKTVEN